MYKWGMFSLFILACAVGLIVFSLNVNESSKEKAAAEKEAATPHLTLTASNFHFDKPEYDIKAGSKLKVTLQLAEGVHAAEITGYNVKLDQANPSQEVTFDKPGEYEIHCVLLCGSGHANMHSKLIVK